MCRSLMANSLNRRICVSRKQKRRSKERDGQIDRSVTPLLRRLVFATAIQYRGVSHLSNVFRRVATSRTTTQLNNQPSSGVLFRISVAPNESDGH